MCSYSSSCADMIEGFVKVFIETCLQYIVICACNTNVLYYYVQCIYTADINECNGNNLCQHNCINQNGSYLCSCKNGFVLLSNQRSCKGTI